MALSGKVLAAWAVLSALLFVAWVGAEEPHDYMARAQAALDAADAGAELPSPWSARDRGEWELEVAEGPVPGLNAILARRVEDGSLRVTTLTDPRDLERGAVFELSAKAMSKHPGGTVRLQFQASVSGMPVRFAETFALGNEFERCAFRFEICGAPGTEAMARGAIHIFPGSRDPDPLADAAILVGGVSLRKVDADEEDFIGAPTYRADPDPVQGLYAFMERQGVKPYDLFWEDTEREVMKTRRLIFNDRRHGTQVWMIDDSPAADPAGTASVWSPWNADGSLQRHRSLRPDPEGNTVRRTMLFNADFSRKHLNIPGTAPRNIVWHNRRNPDLGYVHGRPGGAVYEINVRTNDVRTLAEWETYSNERIYGMTKCGRYLFLDTPNGGIWVPYEPGDVPFGSTPRLAGRPARPNPDGSPHHPGRDAETYQSWRPVSYTPGTPDTEFGPLLRVRIGMLIDLETGETEKVIAPLAADTAYLRTYLGQNGRVLFPEGPGWDEYRVLTADTVEGLFEIYHNFPHTTHGHSSRTPCGQFEVDDGGTLRIFDIREGAIFRSLSLSPTGSHYHLQWTKHPRFFVGWVRGWSFRSFIRHPNANTVYQAFSDGTWQPVFNTKHGINAYYGGGDFSSQSPDSTKLHTATSLAGRFRNYVAVMARPRPPVNLSWRAAGGAVQLSWAPSDYSRETKGYLVYRSERSGDGYELMTPDHVEGTSWRDATVQPGRTYYYVVTSLEQSGLESGYSEEAARAGVNVPANLDAPLVVYAEAEHAIRDLETAAYPGLAMGADRLGASDWYYIYRHPEAERGEAELQVNVPADGRYHVWARVRSARPARGDWGVSLGGRTLSVGTDAREWTWVRAAGGPAALQAGRRTIVLSTSARPAQMDLLCLATDANFTPEGPRPEGRTPPPSPANLHAENVRERANRLAWQRPDHPQIFHYHVYASTEPGFEPSQETRIASPTEEELLDWGLRAGTAYHYAVTAVDRRGNESAPARVSQPTPDAEHPPFELELAFAEAELEGPFERSEADALRGPAYVVPEEPANNRAVWRVNIPREGEYYLWLRYLLRGTGARGRQIRQLVNVRANGRRVARLGGQTDIHAADELIAEGHPLADRLWTWDRPGEINLESATLPAGEVKLVLDNLAPNMRYDVLVITDEPSFFPQDGRLRGN